MNSLDNLLSRLDKAKRIRKGTHQACCPAHADKSPSLIITENDEGLILLHCFAGCSAPEIVAAIGMDMSDLFPPRQHHGKPQRRPFPAADVLRAIGFEALFIASIGVAILGDKKFSDSDRQRLILAVSRIQSAMSAAGVNHG
jgi:hypothetical protein